MEGLRDCVDKLVVGEGTRANNDDVVAEVVGSTVVSEGVSVQVLHKVGVTSNGLTHHVVSEAVEVTLLKGHAHLVSV